MESLTLAEDVARVRARGSMPVVVFDLDGTLMDNRPRTIAILRECAQLYPELAHWLTRITPDSMHYGLEATLRAHGLDDADSLARVSAFWRERFFSNAWLSHDVEVPGAVQYVRRLHAAGAHLVYLTGRDLPNMGSGTFESLQKLGYPIGEVRTSLVCKPRFDIPDDAFKTQIAPSLGELGDVIASFDNEPANCNAFIKAFPTMKSVFVCTQHAPNPPPLDPRVVVIRDFRSLR